MFLPLSFNYNNGTIVIHYENNKISEHIGYLDINNTNTIYDYKNIVSKMKPSLDNPMYHTVSYGVKVKGKGGWFFNDYKIDLFKKESYDDFIIESIDDITNGYQLDAIKIRFIRLRKQSIIESYQVHDLNPN